MMLFICIIIASYFKHKAHSYPANSPPKGQSVVQASSLGTSWTGWKNIQNLFVFGDSYTSTGFDPKGAQPSHTNPIGNPAWPGDTTIGSSDWINYLTFQYNQSFINTYNFAAPGGVIDDEVDPSPFGALSFRQQVNEQFSPNYRNGRGGWAAKDSLFLVWFGVNDVLLLNAKADAYSYIDALTESYVGIVETLHNSGARNFLFLNVPAVDRIPSPHPNSNATTVLNVKNKIVTLYLRFSPSERRRLKQFIARFNMRMQLMTNLFGQMYRDSTVWLFDTNDLFNRVLDDPTAYSISEGISNTDDYCAPYARSTDPKLFRPECGVSRDKYFWADGLHPTSTVHQLVAEQVAGTLSSAIGSNGTVATD